MRYTIAILALLIGVSATGYADSTTSCTTDFRGDVTCTTTDY